MYYQEEVIEISEALSAFVGSYQDELSHRFPRPFVLVQGYASEGRYAQSSWMPLFYLFSTPTQKTYPGNILLCLEDHEGIELP